MIKKDKIVYYLSKYGILIAFILICTLLSLSSRNFLTTRNLLNVMMQVSVMGIIAIGMTFVIITGGIDLSVGSILALSAVIASSFAHPNTYPLIVPILLALLIGVFVGIINGSQVAYWRIAPFIVTLATMTSVRGLALLVTKGQPVINLSESYNKIGGGIWGVAPIPVLIFLAFIVIAAILLHFTRFGRHVYATGGNEVSARLSGVNTSFIKVLVFSISGLSAGMAGMVLSSRVMAGAPSLGYGYELDAIAAVVIGGTSLAGGIGSIWGTVVGVFIIGVLNNGMDLLNISSYYQQILKGVIIIIAVLMDKNSRKSR
jgi:ribose/xylose/arabinose/galactoside ABC-type transport system permease subunit